MKQLFIAIAIVLLFLFSVTWVAYSTTHKAECYVRGMVQSGKPWTWEGGNTCVMAKETPKEEKKQFKKHKWMI